MKGELRERVAEAIKRAFELEHLDKTLSMRTALLLADAALEARKRWHRGTEK